MVCGARLNLLDRGRRRTHTESQRVADDEPMLDRFPGSDRNLHVGAAWPVMREDIARSWVLAAPWDGLRGDDGPDVAR